MLLLCDYYVIIMLLLCYYYDFIKFLYRLYTNFIMSVSKPHNTSTKHLLIDKRGCPFRTASHIYLYG